MVIIWVYNYTHIVTMINNIYIYLCLFHDYDMGIYFLFSIMYDHQNVIIKSNTFLSYIIINI